MMTAIFSYIYISCVSLVSGRRARGFCGFVGVLSTRISVDAHVPICYNEAM